MEDTSFEIPPRCSFVFFCNFRRRRQPRTGDRCRRQLFLPRRVTMWSSRRRPAGPTSAMARTIAQKLGPLLGQAMIVEDKAGANGSIASEFVAHAAPDGHHAHARLHRYTRHESSAAAIALRPRQRFRTDWTRGIFGDAYGGQSRKVPIKDVKDLVAQLKAKPDRYSYASAGNGTAPHFAAELFKLNA